MMSAKYQMPNCSISLLTERETDNNLKDSRNLINEYLAEKVVIDLDSSFSPMQKSRWLKTSMRDLVKGDFLYVDVDTVFATPINEDLFKDDVMGVPDGNCILNDHPMKWFIEENLKKLQFDSDLEYHINSGVLYFKDSSIAHSFCQKWHQRWNESCKKEIFIDQPALHQAIVDTGRVLKILPNYMNAQFGRNINTLATGVILHYYSSWANNSLYTPAYRFLQKEWLSNFRKNPTTSDSKNLIKNPKEAFDQTTLIMGSNFNHFFNSTLANYLANLHISSDKADIRLLIFFEKQNLFLAKIYYRVLKILYPLKNIIKKL